MNLKEDHKEIKSGKIKDQEGYMANIEFDQIERSLNILRKAIKKPTDQLPAWVQSKITRAADFIDTAAEYLSSDEEISEGKDLSFAIKKSSGAGALTPDAAKQLGPKAIELQKKRAGSVSLPKVKEKVKNFTEEKEMRFCKACDKEESRDQCSYGPKIWDKYTIKRVSESVLNINQEFDKMF